jgi:hypothetical protein
MKKFIFAFAAALLLVLPAQAIVLTNTAVRSVKPILATTTVELERTSTDSGTRTINTLTEPSKTIDLTPVVNDQATQLNPQPEPPIGAASVLTTEPESGQGVQTSVENLRERVMLNPQPEPPAPANIYGDKVEMENQMTGASIPNFSQTVKLGGKVEIKNEQTLYLENGNSYALKSVPAIYYQKLTANLAKSGMGEGSVKSLELKTDNNKPVYEIQVSEPVKWFGLFKGNIQTKVTVAADSEKIQKVKRPWYSFLLSVSGIQKDIELLPNLRVSEVKITPSSYKEGDNIQLEATIINDGPGFAVGGCDLFTGGGLKTAMYIDGYVGQWYCLFLALHPGESMSLLFNWDNVKCGHTVSAKIDTASYMEETDETDNETATMTNCQ